MRIILILIAGFISIPLLILASMEKQKNGVRTEFISKETIWVDSVFTSLSTERKIAQLFMVAAYSNKTLAENSSVTDLVKNTGVGGVIFFQGGPVKLAAYNNYWKSLSKVPLFVAIDGEWGLGMRLKDSTVSFPRQMSLGAIQNDSLIYDMGAEIAMQCKRLGININFAPVADINSNSLNPVINYRSFGEDKFNVFRKCYAYARGLQDNGVIPTAKHFPGHGDTDKDSHKTLPTVYHNTETIYQTDLYPFQELINKQIAGIMVGHLYVPALDSSRVQPSTLSYPIVTELLQNKMNFNGLIFTDALNMKGAANADSAGELELKAFLAGNDVLLMSENVPAAITKIKNAILEKPELMKLLDAKCRKILRYKYQFCRTPKTEKFKNIYSNLNNSHSDFINQKLYYHAVTLLKNDGNFLPFCDLEKSKIASIQFNEKASNDFDKLLDKYAPITHFFMPAKTTVGWDSLQQKLNNFDVIILTIHQTSFNSDGNYGFTDNIIDFIGKIKQGKSIVLNLLCNPYGLAKLTDTSGITSIITAYQPNEYTLKATAQAIFGGIPIQGKLPVTASPFFKVNHGLSTVKTRLCYSSPEFVAMNQEVLNRIDSLVYQAIKDTVFPGCQVLVARNANVIYEKSFGFYTYDKKNAVNNSNIYDIASLTKIFATTLTVMRLYEDGYICLDSTLAHYLPETKNTNKAKITIKELMTHQAGFKAWIPFYKKLMTNGKLNPEVFSKDKKAGYDIMVSSELYMKPEYKDSILSVIINTELRKKSDYLYSDLGFYLLKAIIERYTKQSLATFVDTYFYKPLGLVNIGYLPKNNISVSRIVPSEIDTSFRNQTLIGDVNDQGAAMLGGVGGHAGLFSNAGDLAVLAQILLNGGYYGGKKYFAPETIRLFTSYQYANNRRGLGFDKPQTDKLKEGPTCDKASPASYGHSGFTGTFVWVDPEYQLIYVFISNRTYPYSATNKLLKSGIRTKIQNCIYEAIQ